LGSSVETKLRKRETEQDRTGYACRVIRRKLNEMPIVDKTGGKAS